MSGQIPADTTGALVEGSIAEKTAVCCKNLKAILEAAGSDISKVVRVGVFLTDMKVCPLHLSHPRGEWVVVQDWSDVSPELRRDER